MADDPIKRKYEFTDLAHDMVISNLAAAMEKHHMSKGALSQKTGLSWRTINNWYTGKCDPSLIKALQLCHATGWDFSEIIGGILDGD